MYYDNGWLPIYAYNTLFLQKKFSYPFIKEKNDDV